jgi:hypothetical protein
VLKINLTKNIFTNWSLDKIDFHRLKPLLGKHWRLRIQIRFLKSETFSQLAFEALAEEISPNSSYKINNSPLAMVSPNLAQSRFIPLEVSRLTPKELYKFIAKFI